MIRARVIKSPAAPSAPPPQITPPQLVPGLGAGGSLASVLQCRAEQITRWGHTPHKDAQRPLGAFMVDLRSMAAAASEDHLYRRSNAQIRRRLVKLAALALATIDRLDMAETDPPSHKGNSDAQI